MKTAKDTVIKYQHSHEIAVGSKEWHHKEGYNLGAEQQAEISFKAGIRETLIGIGGIISWGEYEELPDGTRIRDGHIMSEVWQAQLKEWDIQ